jgi:hypothetical protein
LAYNGREAVLLTFLTALAISLGASPSEVAHKPPLPQTARSAYVSLAADQGVRKRTVLLSRKIVLLRADDVLVESDGTFAPRSKDAAATVFIEVDARRVTNFSSIDWRGSEVPVRHSFNAVGAVRLSRGSHRVALIGNPPTGSFTVSATSNLAIFVHPARRVRVGELAKEAGPFDYRTYGRRGPDAPHDPLVSLTGIHGPTIALGSASMRRGRTTVTRCSGSTSTTDIPVPTPRCGR